MMDFDYIRANTVADALHHISKRHDAKFVAGGTNLIDLMKEGVEQPARLIDITALPLKDIQETQAGGLKIGALMPNSDLAYDERIKKRYPLLSSAILAGASAQLRNMASTGGNLLQRTRCLYFYDVTTPCNKRRPGSGCSAFEGHNRMNAILGWNKSCIAVHPSDMCVALAALDAVVHIASANGDRSIASVDFHQSPRSGVRVCRFKPDRERTDKKHRSLRGARHSRRDRGVRSRQQATHRLCARTLCRRDRAAGRAVPTALQR